MILHSASTITHPLTFQGRKRKQHKNPPISPPAPDNSGASSTDITTSGQGAAPQRGSMGWPMKTVLGLSLLTMGNLARQHVEERSFSQPNIGLTGSSGWGANVNVLASSSQIHVSTNRPGFSYIDALVSRLHNSDSLGKAHNSLATEGYTNLFQQKQFPVASSDLPTVRVENTEGEYQLAPNHCLNTWNKDGQFQKKFAIVLGGYDNGNRNARVMAHTLKQEYELPDDHIRFESHASSQTLTDAVTQFKNRIKKDKIQNAELLIYYNGHGSRAGYPWLPDLSRSEGQASGSIQFSDGWYSETKMKKLLKTLPPDVKITLVMDTCHSGSWIA
jgi:hypothetical protein